MYEYKNTKPHIPSELQSSVILCGSGSRQNFEADLAPIPYSIIH
jgi:hypothetical protein